MKKIKVLVVDDSLVFRRVLSEAISSDPDIEVVAVANDAFDAYNKIIRYQPDVMTCDVEMPRMNGIEFIRRLMPRNPLPVIVVSQVSEAVFDAMNAGAVDFVTKPDVYSEDNLAEFINELISKIKIASLSNLSHWKSKNLPRKSIVNPGINTEGKIIAIGASTGGTEAIAHILKELPPTVPGIVIVQHIPPVFSAMFAERLNRTTQLRAAEARDGDLIEGGKVLIAPGSAQMRVKKAGNKFKVEVYSGEKVNGHQPSVDVLFESVAREYGSNAIGVILTGMGNDGAKGLLAMRRSGARTLGQDESSSVVYGMPRVAYNIGAVEMQVPLEDMSRVICSLLK